jgi:tetratricopeptide (TPR) repeat protein
LKLILRLYQHPAVAMSDVLDQGSLLFFTVAVLALTWIEGRAIPWLPISFYVPMLALAAAYVPGLVALSALVGLGGDFRRDYIPVLTCVAAAWTGANIPVVAITWFQPGFYFAASGLAFLWFLVLVFFAIRTVFGAGNGSTFVVVALSWIPLVAAYFLWGPLRYLLGWLASPFFLFYIFYLLRGEFGDLGAGLRNRQSFRRNLEAAAINPHDGEAQYQLGLVYQQRRQFSEAIRRFDNAVRIDPTHTDAHFQLGRMARAQGRLKDALGEFQTVVNLDERHSQSEVLRELGALYNSAHQYEDAQRELAEYLVRRPYDPEGLFHYGQALEGLGKTAEARDAYSRATEAANLAPSYLKRMAARWGRMARKQARSLAA